MNGEEVVLSLDEGTTGATAVAVGMDGEVRGKGYEEITQHYPRPGWVEHDPAEIWSAVQVSARRALEAANAQSREVRAIGITNQRETLVLWDRKTLQPIAPAIVWQDRRTADQCARLREAGHEQRVRETTGLVLDPYFTATKLAWAINNVAGVADAAAGTVDSWLIARLSAGRDHVTDASNASRTLLFDIGRGAWSDEMAELFGVSLGNLPRVVDSSGRISATAGDALDGVAAPITGIAGDQQAALFGQAVTADGMAKNTDGTGSFVLMQTGGRRVDSASGMLTTIAWRREGKLSYALEGAIFVTGAAVPCACVCRPRRATLGPLRARHDRRPDARHRPRPHRACCGRGDGVSDTGRRRGHAARHRTAPDRAAGRWGRGGDGCALPAAGRPARHPGAAAPPHRDDRAGRGLPGRARRGSVVGCRPDTALEARSGVRAKDVPRRSGRLAVALAPRGRTESGVGDTG